MAVTITSISPTSGPIGTLVTITGTGFTPDTAQNVIFSGSNTQIANPSGTASQITVAVPPGAITGPITVYNSAGSGSSASFTVTNDVTGVQPPSSIPRFRGPWYAITTLPTVPQTWWVVTDGLTQSVTYAQGLGVLQARFAAAPGQFQNPEYLDEFLDLVVVTRAQAAGKVGAAGLQAYDAQNPA